MLLEVLPPIALSLKALVQSQPEMQSGRMDNFAARHLAQLP